jgi:hypothetical protein
MITPGRFRAPDKLLAMLRQAGQTKNWTKPRSGNSVI